MLNAVQQVLLPEIAFHNFREVTFPPARRVACGGVRTFPGPQYRSKPKPPVARPRAALGFCDGLKKPCARKLAQGQAQANVVPYVQ